MNTLAVLVIASLFVGISKTALPGLTTVAVALCAAVLPAKESTAVLLILLLIGDLIAVKTWFHYVQWDALRKLVAGVLLGVGLGVLVLMYAPDLLLRRGIGILLIILTVVTVIMTYTNPSSFASRKIRFIYGTLAGFTTMTANSGGPVVTLYFLASGFSMKRFLGTQAWFFFIVNIVKLMPILGMNLISTQNYHFFPILIPCVIIGALLGKVLVHHLNNQVFTIIIIGLTIISSLYLIIA